MSEELQSFFDAYANWLNAGAPERQPFSRARGLCGNLRLNRFESLDIFAATDTELSNMFNAVLYPFGEESYCLGILKGTLHLCPKRRAFVFAHANVKEVPLNE